MASRRHRPRPPGGVPAPPSRYVSGGVTDYSHRFHAGNVGDVWKHCALVAVLRRAVATAGRVAYLDTHAGEGRYPLGPTGEWTEGIGRLAIAGDGLPGAVADYLALCGLAAPGRPASYPGSPALARRILGPTSTLRLWERDGDAHARLEREVADDARVHLVRGNGLAELGRALRAAAAETEAVVALIDPPWTDKADWRRIPDALAAAARASTLACLLLWYPVKSLTRPNAMVAQLEDDGVAGTLAELVTTPLDQRRRRLNGSGLLLVRPPAGVLDDLAGLAPAIAARCATVAGAWSFRMRSFVAGGRGR